LASSKLPSNDPQFTYIRVGLLTVEVFEISASGDFGHVSVGSLSIQFDTDMIPFKQRFER